MEIDWEAVVEAEMNAGGALAADAEFLALREKVLRGEVKIEIPEGPIALKPEDVEMVD